MQPRADLAGRSRESGAEGVTESPTDDWPLFAGIPGVVEWSATIRRGNESIDSALTQAMTALLADGRVQGRVSGRVPVLLTRTVRKAMTPSQVLRDSRRGVWGSFPDDELPDGVRAETPQDNGVIATIHLDSTAGLPQAIRFTRANPFAICVLDGPRFAELLDAALQLRAPAPLFDIAKGLIPGLEVFRAHGAFDDRDVSASLFVPAPGPRQTCPRG